MIVKKLKDRVLSRQNPNRQLLIFSLKALTSLLIISALPAYAAVENSLFLIKPYIQLGNNNRPGDTVELNWRTGELTGEWTIEKSVEGLDEWREEAPPQSRFGHIPSMPGHLVFKASITGLEPGQKARYRILKDGKVVFSAPVRRQWKPEQLCRFVVFGDLAAGSPAQKKIAYQIYFKQPDYAVLTGDIVYPFGRFSDYWARFYPVYNSDRPDPERGAPLLRSTTFIAAPGNHDLSDTGHQPINDLTLFPDGLAYYYLWHQPLNGPLSDTASKNITPVLGPEKLRDIFFKEAGANYPVMASFSFDWGNAHWTILDSNEYVDWSDKTFLNWLKDDLKGAKRKLWRFVAFHHAPFSSTMTHFNQQHMRRLTRVFEEGKVDLVFSGHVHNYQRTYPLRFAAAESSNGPGPVSGKLHLDKSFPAKRKPKPDGVIYIITGAGGAKLTGGFLGKVPFLWRPYTRHLNFTRHSFTLCDIKGRQLLVRQIDDDGNLLDHFCLEK